MQRVCVGPQYQCVSYNRGLMATANGLSSSCTLPAAQFTKHSIQRSSRDASCESMVAAFRSGQGLPRILPCSLDSKFETFQRFSAGPRIYQGYSTCQRRSCERQCISKSSGSKHVNEGFDRTNMDDPFNEVEHELAGTFNMEQNGKIERERCADGVPMIVWYAKMPIGDWQSQLDEQRSMNLITLLSISVVANMTTLVFSSILALISADMMRAFQQSHASEGVQLFVNFLYFGLIPVALARTYKSVVRLVMAPVRKKYKAKMGKISKLSSKGVGRWVVEIIQVLAFEGIRFGDKS
jgi:hypothetical protein